jgi:membrane protease YdiL (CAAX protease family)
MLALLTLYLYPLGTLREKWLEPWVVMPADFYDEPFLVYNAMLLLWLPLLFTWGVLREEPGALGFARGDWRPVGPWLIVAAVGMLGVVAVAGRMPVFQQMYPLRALVRHEPSYLLYYELSYGFYFFCWEWFFRGFLLFGLARGCGRWAILLQAVPFGFLHWGKPVPEVIGSFAAGLILGEVALRARSFLPCFALHWLVAMGLDLSVLSHQALR